MSVYVIDASVALAWFFEEAHTAAALRGLTEENRLHAPGFFLIEIDNVVCTRIRRGEITGEEGGRIRSAIRQFPVHMHPFAPLLDPAYETAVQTRQTLYDSLYVALAVAPWRAGRDGRPAALRCAGERAAGIVRALGRGRVTDRGPRPSSTPSARWRATRPGRPPTPRSSPGAPRSTGY